MVTTYHLGADDLRDECKPSVLEHFLDVLPVLRKACSSEYFCFLVFVLKFGQSQPHTSDVGNVGTVSSDLSSEGVSESVELGQDSRSAYQDFVERR